MTRTLTRPKAAPTETPELNPEDPRVIALRTKVEWLHDEKERLDALGTAWNEAQEEILTLMDELGVKEYDTGTYTATYRQSSRDTVDWAGIEATLDPAEWDRVTKRVGDRESLIAAIDQKLISERNIKRLKKYVTETLTKAWVATKPSKPAPRAPRRP